MRSTLPRHPSRRGRRNEQAYLGMRWRGRPARVLRIALGGSGIHHRLLGRFLRSGVGARSRRGAGCSSGSRRRLWKRQWRIAVRVEERDDVGAVLWITETCEGHLRARRERLGAGHPLAEIIPVPAAALLRQSVGKSKAPALANRRTEHAPQVRAHLVRAALVGIVAGHALVESLLALRSVCGRQVNLDRLLGRRAARAFFLNSGDRITHLLRTLAVEILAGDNRRRERDNPREQHPAGDGIEAIVHEVSLVFEKPKGGRFEPPLKRDFSVHQAASQRSKSVRAMAKRGGGWNGPPSGSAMDAATSSRVNQRASSSSAVSMVSSLCKASARQPIMSEEGKGQGWLAR